MPSPVILDMHFGDYSPPPALEQLERTSLAWQPTVGDDGVSLVISQLRPKVRFGMLLRGLLAGPQDLEDGIWSTLIGIWLDTAEGVNLDGLGVLLDLARAGWSDDTYRAYLKAQVLVLGSDGSGKTLVAVMRAMGVTLELTTMERSGMAAIHVVLGELLDGIEPVDIFAMLERAKSAGVRLRLDFPTAPLDETFAASDDGAWHVDTLRGAANDDRTSGGYVDGDERTTEAA